MRLAEPSWNTGQTSPIKLKGLVTLHKINPQVFWAHVGMGMLCSWHQCAMFCGCTQKATRIAQHAHAKVDLVMQLDNRCAAQLDAHSKAENEPCKQVCRLDVRGSHF